jgi:hypothetical protein
VHPKSTSHANRSGRIGSIAPEVRLGGTAPDPGAGNMAELRQESGPGGSRAELRRAEPDLPPELAAGPSDAQERQGTDELPQIG